MSYVDLDTIYRASGSGSVPPDTYSDQINDNFAALAVSVFRATVNGSSVGVSAGGPVVWPVATAGGSAWTGGGVLTVPVAGWYRVSFSLLFATNVATASAQINCVLNGSTPASPGYVGSYNNTISNMYVGSDELYLAAASTIFMTSNVAGVVSGDTRFSYFDLVRYSG